MTFGSLYFSLFKMVLIFPGPNSISLKDLGLHLQRNTKKNVCGEDDDSTAEPLLKQARIESEQQNINECKANKSEGTGLKKIIFIDSTWNQTNKIITDERLQGKINSWKISDWNAYSFNAEALIGRKTGKS